NFRDKRQSKFRKVYPLDSRGKKERVDYVEKTLRISYNPKDTVYARRTSFSDGSWSRERKGSITFIVDPKKDGFVINYDSLLVEDIKYYLEDRIEREHYVRMMPVLWML